MIEYANTADGIGSHQLSGFFEGWAEPPSAETHLRILNASSAVVLAIDDEQDRVVGFITAVSDGVLAAYIPLLEVLPSHRGRGIGSELVRRVLDAFTDLYMVDLVCDDGLRPFYEGHGMTAMTGMARRNFDAQSGRVC